MIYINDVSLARNLLTPFKIHLKSASVRAQSEAETKRFAAKALVLDEKQTAEASAYKSW